MKNWGCFGLIVMIAVCIIAVRACTMTGEAIDNEAEYKDYVGDELVIKKDTLIIVDYSTIDKNFTLDNGRKVSFKFVQRYFKHE
jgi:hypothetical protein